MAFLGLNVARDGSTDARVISWLGASWVRIVAMPDIDLREYFSALRGRGIRILLVLARESFSGVDNLTTYRERYGGLVSAIQVGNEPDLASESSWTMTPGQLAALGQSVRRAFPSHHIVCGGLASGDPAWLEGFDHGWADSMACLVPDQRVTARAPAAASVREYQGNVITIKTAGGNQVTCTPNHPILTRDGWLPAGAIKEGSQVAYDAGTHRAGTWGPNDVQVPTVISEVFRALEHQGQRLTRRGLPLDFHGDGQDGDVHVVRTDRFLRDALPQRRTDIVLQVAPPVRLAFAGSGDQRLQARPFAGAREPIDLRLDTRADRVATTLEHDVNGALLDAQALGNRPTRFAGRVPLVQGSNMRVGVSPPSPALANGEPPLLQFFRKVGAAYPDLSGESLQGLPAGVAFVEVVEVETRQFSGHVYNLSTEDGIICADGIVTHNCHPYLKDAPNPGDLEDLPDVTGLLDAYRSVVPDKPWLVTEWGWWSDEEPRATDEVRDMAYWAAGTERIPGFFYFCASDAMVPPFGLLRADGSEKPRADAFRRAAQAVRLTAWPAPPSEQPPELTPEPSEPDPGTEPWRWWTPEQIAAVTECPEASVREYWPKIVDQMMKAGVWSKRSAAAAIATVAIETASRFEPVREGFYLGDKAEAYRRTLRYYPHYGRGHLQVTWLSNYRKYTDALKEFWGPDAPDLVAFPDLALDPWVSAAVLALYWRDHGGDGQRLVYRAAEAEDWTEVRRLVQGGADGLARLVHIATVLLAQAAPDDGPDQIPEIDDSREAEVEGLKTAIRYLVDVVLPQAAAGAQDRELALAEGARVKAQFTT